MKTLVIQSSPCYSAVSALLTNPLPDCSNYSPLLLHPLTSLQINTSLVSSGQTLYQAAQLETNTSLLQHFTTESSLEQQAEASVDVPYPPLQIVNSRFHFVSFLSISSYPLSTPFLNRLSSPSPKIKTSSFITFCFTNGTYFCILFHTMTYFLIMHSISL